MAETDSPQVLFEDGFGVRVGDHDPASGDALERLYVSDTFKTVTEQIRERTSRLTNLRHIRFVRLRALERDKERALYVLADAAPGVRLVRVLELASLLELTIDVDTVLHVLRELLPALTLLHDSRSVTHGAVGPERLIVTDKGRVVVCDHMFGAALDKLRLSRGRLWQLLRVPMPPAAGIPRFDKRSDVAQVGMVALAMLLGRPLTEEEFPTRLPAILDTLTETPRGGRTERLSKGLRAWLERALPIDARKPFLTTKEAQTALEDVVAGRKAYGPSSAALKALVTTFLAELSRQAPAGSATTADRAPDSAIERVPITAAFAVSETQPPASTPLAPEASASADFAGDLSASEHPVNPLSANALPMAGLAAPEADGGAAPLVEQAPESELSPRPVAEPTPAESSEIPIAVMPAPVEQASPATPLGRPNRTSRGKGTAQPTHGDPSSDAGRAVESSGAPEATPKRRSSHKKKSNPPAPLTWHPSIDETEAEEIRRLEAELARLAALEQHAAASQAGGPRDLPVGDSAGEQVIDLDFALDMLADANPPNEDGAWVLDLGSTEAAVEVTAVETEQSIEPAFAAESALESPSQLGPGPSDGTTPAPPGTASEPPTTQEAEPFGNEAPEPLLGQALDQPPVSPTVERVGVQPASMETAAALAEAPEPGISPPDTESRSRRDGHGPDRATPVEDRAIEDAAVVLAATEPITEEADVLAPVVQARAGEPSVCDAVEDAWGIAPVLEPAGASKTPGLAPFVESLAGPLSLAEELPVVAGVEETLLVWEPAADGLAVTEPAVGEPVDDRSLGAGMVALDGPAMPAAAEPLVAGFLIAGTEGPVVAEPAVVQADMPPDMPQPVMVEPVLPEPVPAEPAWAATAAVETPLELCDADDEPFELSPPEAIEPGPEEISPVAVEMVPHPAFDFEAARLGEALAPEVASLQPELAPIDASCDDGFSLAPWSSDAVVEVPGSHDVDATLEAPGVDDAPTLPFESSDDNLPDTQPLIADAGDAEAAHDALSVSPAEAPALEPATADDGRGPFELEVVAFQPAGALQLLSDTASADDAAPLVEAAQEVWQATGTDVAAAYTFHEPLALDAPGRARLLDLERDLGALEPPAVWLIPTRWREPERATPTIAEPIEVRVAVPPPMEKTAEAEALESEAVIEAAIADEPVPDALLPDAPVPDTPVLDAPVPEARATDASAARATATDATVAEQTVTDATVAEQTVTGELAIEEAGTAAAGEGRALGTAAAAVVVGEADSDGAVGEETRAMALVAEPTVAEPTVAEQTVTGESAIEEAGTAATEEAAAGEGRALGTAAAAVVVGEADSEGAVGEETREMALVAGPTVAEPTVAEPTVEEWAVEQLAVEQGAVASEDLDVEPAPGGPVVVEEAGSGHVPAVPDEMGLETLAPQGVATPETTPPPPSGVEVLIPEGDVSARRVAEGLVTPSPEDASLGTERASHSGPAPNPEPEAMSQLPRQPRSGPETGSWSEPWSTLVLDATPEPRTQLDATPAPQAELDATPVPQAELDARPESQAELGAAPAPNVEAGHPPDAAWRSEAVQPHAEAAMEPSREAKHELQPQSFEEPPTLMAAAAPAEVDVSPEAKPGAAEFDDFLPAASCEDEKTAAALAPMARAASPAVAEQRVAPAEAPSVTSAGRSAEEPGEDEDDARSSAPITSSTAPSPSSAIDSPRGSKRSRRRKKKASGESLVRRSSFAAGRMERPPMPAPPWLRGKTPTPSTDGDAATPAASGVVANPPGAPPATPTTFPNVQAEAPERPVVPAGSAARATVPVPTHVAGTQSASDARAAAPSSPIQIASVFAQHDHGVDRSSAASVGESSPRSLSVARMAGLLAVGLLLEGVVLGGWAWMVRPAATGRLLVVTRPHGIQVMLDGKVVGETPYAAQVPPGTHVVQLTGRSITRKIDIAVPVLAQGATFVRWPTEAARGNVTISSVPDGARVAVDGEDKGTAPVTLYDLPVGPHAVTVTGRRGSVETTVEVKADRMVEIEVPIYSGWVSVFSAVPLDISEAGKLLGTTETDRIMLGAGTHDLELSNVQLGYRATHAVQIVPGKVVPLSIELPTAPLFVDVEAGVEIWVDGERVGYTPAMDLRVPIGTRVVLLKRPGRPDERHVVSVRMPGPTRVGPGIP